MLNPNWRRALAPFALLVIALPIAGCGNITDKDRIVIGEIDGETIRRGDLRKLIRDMDDDKRPVIHNRADLLRVLNEYIDNIILDQAAAELRAEDKITVPREKAMERHFNRFPEDRIIYQVESAEELQRQDFDVSEGQLAAFQADIDFKIDDVEQELYREAALDYLIQDALRIGRLTITEEEFKQEYEAFKDQLKSLERVGFVGVRFNAQVSNAAEKAAECRRLLNEGRSFEQLLAMYHAVDPDLIFESMIENNPNLPRFKSFWEKVTGASVGDVFGPLYLPAHDIVEQLPDGTTRVITQPAAYVVIQVTVHVPPREKTWEEAKNDLAPQILRRKMIRQLREEHGVQVYEDQLPDPGRYDKDEQKTFVDVDY